MTENHTSALYAYIRDALMRKKEMSQGDVERLYPDSKLAEMREKSPSTFEQLVNLVPEKHRKYA